MTEYSDKVIAERIPLASGLGELGVVTLDEPERLNPLSWPMVTKLGSILEELAADDTVRVIAITGAGRAFSVGGDMIRYAELQRDRTAFAAFLREVNSVFERVSQYRQPVVALVNGIAVAGGLELMLSCDFAMCTETSTFGDLHLKFGQMGGAGMLSLLPRAIGPARARELIFSGRTMDAAEAADIGLVTKVVPSGELLNEALDFADRVSRTSPLGVANMKRVLNQSWWFGTGMDAGSRLEQTEAARYCSQSSDALEGLAAFADKRRPAYTGS